ncbi:ABC transporter ATP-binding protein [bacterium 1XD42-54]|nr:ABC transporter ATP-binding protein [bacterium 1XD42-54]
MSIQITAEHVVKKFDKETTVIPDLSLVIKEGELFTLLGPSGCGKTTFLRMLAGFYPLDGGHIYFGERRIDCVPVHERNIGMVFQNYAIFPHMTTAQNVEYGLKQRKVDKALRNKKVKEILETVRMEEYADRLPAKLSGGQQQRIALARAIVIRPDVLLMDEPLSNLDAKLRIEMRSTIREIQKQSCGGITTVYVTHDQEEALAISDRIAVINKGVIQQVDTPRRIYQYPANIFVATFIGFSNLFHGTVRIQDGKKQVQIGDCLLPVLRLGNNVQDGQKVIVSMRADDFTCVSEGGIWCKIKSDTFLGQNMNYAVEFENKIAVETEDGNELVESVRTARHFYRQGERICIMPDAEKLNVFTDDGGTSLMDRGDDT